MILASSSFAIQDGISRYLANEYNVMMVVMIRYWFFAAFVIVLASRKPGGLKAVAKTQATHSAVCQRDASCIRGLRNSPSFYAFRSSGKPRHFCVLSFISYGIVCPNTWRKSRVAPMVSNYCRIYWCTNNPPTWS